ncbi:MAG: OmpH family outer membrane protein [Rikenellaceae bacterium]|nr:OmpH family outer membrane protein [Rikenellaceae bacterium]MCL2693176.1 OmpH family outer membrane protein [Rikenellaceae bacterium]
MKKLFVAATLAFAAFAMACGNNPKNAVTVTEVGSTDENVERHASGQIAYIRIDSLMFNYDMYNDLSAAFETKVRQVEADLTSRARTFERNVSDFQTRAERGLMTRAEAAQQEENLQRQQQTLMTLHEQRRQELAEEEAVMTNRIMYSIEEYVKEFNHDYRYGMIITTSGGAPVINADPALDITSLILRGLNERYAQQK